MARVRIPFLSLSGQVRFDQQLKMSPKDKSIVHLKDIDILRGVHEPFTPHSASQSGGFTLSLYTSLAYGKNKRKGVVRHKLQILPLGHTPLRMLLARMAGWPSGLRRWFKAPVTSVARVRISLLSVLDVAAAIICRCNTNVTNVLVSTGHSRPVKDPRQDGRVV